MADTAAGQLIISEADALKGGMEPSDIWLVMILKAKEDEKTWRDEASKAVEIYEGGETSKNQRISFNIYHSNIETMVPATYNSTPIPDIRRRYDDPDPVSKLGADVIERALSFSVDQYDFDSTMRAVTRSALITGRGVVRVRYKPQWREEPHPETGEPMEVKGYEEVACEIVPWDRFIRGPAHTWDAVPWIAFEHDLTAEEIGRLKGEDASATDVPLDGESKGEKKDLQATPDAGVFKTAKVFEIWDRRRGMVVFITDKKGDKPLRVEPDPLGLPGFYPVPRPLQPIMRETTLEPICPYSIYQPLIEELDVVTKRISRLVKQLRVRGIYDSSIKADLSQLSDVDDGTYLPANDATAFATGAGGLDKAISHFPMEPAVLALRELYTQRDAIKQTIYEVTGLADIVRGASQASETATAQQIKAQYAGLRIQFLQKEVARVARDLFRMKTAIFCRHFEPENLQVMTGLQIPPEVVQLLQSDAMRSYRIDIESDSTIRGDVQRSLEQMTQFIQGTGQFVQAVAGMVQAAPPLLAPFLEVYTAFARKFDLGKQAEDALDKLPQMVGQWQQQQAQQPSPEAQKAEADMKAKEADLQMARESHQMDMQAKQMDVGVKQQIAQIDLAKSQQQAQIDMQKTQFGLQAAQQKAMIPQPPPSNGRPN